MELQLSIIKHQLARILHLAYSLPPSLIKAMSPNCYIITAPVLRTAELDLAQLQGVSFLKKLGERAQFRAVGGALYVYIRAAQTLPQMRSQVSGKLNPLGFTARVSEVTEEELAQRIVTADHEVEVLDAIIGPAPAQAQPIVAHSTSLRMVMDLLPLLSRGDRHNVLFKLVLMDAPPVTCLQQTLLRVKEEMATIVLECPLAEWGIKLAPYAS